MSAESMMDKVRRFKASRPQGFSGNRIRGIFHKWKEGDNVIRLAGEFIEVKTHYIAPNVKRQERGLCQAVAFQGDNALSQTINCFDWDVTTEEPRKAKTCPVCALARIARDLMRTAGVSEEDKKNLNILRQQASAKSNLKWNIFDREDPYVLMIDESGKESRVLGFKIATVGMEAWNDIEGIFEQCAFDITDPDNGIDIKVIRGNNGTRTQYSAQAILSGKELKVTPFSEEERALQLHDLKAICGKMSSRQAVFDALHEDLRELIDLNSSPAVDASLEKEADEATADVVSEEPVSEGLPVEVRAAATEAIEDGDGLMAGTASSPVVPKAPVAAPRAPVMAPKAPVATPRAPVAAPRAPVAPKAPVAAPVAPRSPVVAPRAPIAAPKAPVAVPRVAGTITPRRAVPVSDPQKPPAK
jgi:hypothetical protein